MGFLIGLLTGAVIALLYAPKPGDLTRDELRARSEELRRRADELQKIAQDLSAQAQVKGRARKRKAVLGSRRAAAARRAVDVDPGLDIFDELCRRVADREVDHSRADDLIELH